MRIKGCCFESEAVSGLKAGKDNDQNCPEGCLSLGL